MATDVLGADLAATQNFDWAAQVESETSVLPPREGRKSWKDKDGLKHVIEVLENEQGDKIKIETTTKVITKMVPKPIAERKKWSKFGASASDPSGPSPATTYVADEVKMQFIRNRAGELLLGEMSEDEEQRRMKLQTQGAAHCRLCKSTDHWSRNCPYKDMINPDGEGDDLLGDGSGTGPPPTSIEADALNQRKRDLEEKQRSGKYISPAVRAGASTDRPGAGSGGPGSSMDRRDENTVRVTNLPEDADEQDLRSLFSTMGRVSRIYLAKDKLSGKSKGFAFVTFEHKSDAQAAIDTISKHKYGYSILKVEWARPNP